ncbi:MBL fold metallo-hydrolase [Miltoncostaea marina]|uniref:MBL fold metallo-hydrolase n=1 Tax=Miltoncostaea marina TaxID=2843215 RepID=UPI001C3C815A|nr:MBL fold metallo-hydrolase [Miltoncostaea marina]
MGVGAAYARHGEVQSCHLVRAGGAAVAVDLGSGTLNRLQAHVAPEDLAALVITHMHPDHCVDLLALRVYMAWGPGAGRTVRVIGPPGLRDRLAAFAGSEGWEPGLRFEELAPEGGELELGGGLTVRHRPVPHLDPTHAVRVQHGGAAVCLGADCAPGDALPELAAGCDLLVLECTFGADPVPEGVPHLNASAAGALAARAGARRLLLTHCQPEHDRDAALAAARAAFGGPVGWAVQDTPVPA